MPLMRYECYTCGYKHPTFENGEVICRWCKHPMKGRMEAKSGIVPLPKRHRQCKSLEGQQYLFGPTGSRRVDPPRKQKGEGGTVKLKRKSQNEYVRMEDLTETGEIFTIEGVAMERLPWNKEDEGPELIVTFKEIPKKLVLESQAIYNDFVDGFGDDTDEWGGKLVRLYAGEMQGKNGRFKCRRAQPAASSGLTRAAQGNSAPPAKSKAEKLKTIAMVSEGEDLETILEQARDLFANDEITLAEFQDLRETVTTLQA